jgi:ferrous iron transport protein B
MSSYVAIVGAPNTGKTSLYNQITGSHYKTVNYPGATVDYSLGDTRSQWGAPFPIVDTPGTYSLFPKSADEQVTSKILFEGIDQASTPRTVVVVVDATRMRRDLLVVEQSKEAGFDVVVALTMTDLLAKQGLVINCEALSESLGSPVVPVNGLTGNGVPELINALRARDNEYPREIRKPQQWNMEQHFQFASKAQRIFERVVSKQGEKTKHDPALVTRKIDGVMLHPFWGIFLFALIMTGMFTAIFWLATPFMDFVDGAFSWAAEATLSANPNSLFFDFLANGLITSLGAVVIFVPQIVILFLVVGLLEDTGYLSRAATLIDKPLAKIGLNGRSFVPMLSGFACAIPAMMAARTIGSKREKFITLFIVPLFSCSARLPVYALLVSFLFYGDNSWKPGVAMAAIYISSIVIALVAAALLNRLTKTNETSFFMMELPYYRRPSLRSVIRGVWTRTYGYLTRAAPVIIVLSVIMWVGSSFPRPNGEARLDQSYLASAGRVLEPVMEPMGGDWRTGVSLLSAFAAREVFVSSLAVMLNVAEQENEDDAQKSLLEQMHNAKTEKGAPLFTTSTAVGLILFFVVALQCLTTVGVARREFGGWTMPLVQLAVFNLVAYAMAVAAVQGLRFLGLP